MVRFLSKKKWYWLIINYHLSQSNNNTSFIILSFSKWHVFMEDETVNAHTTTEAVVCLLIWIWDHTFNATLEQQMTFRIIIYFKDLNCRLNYGYLSNIKFTKIDVDNLTMPPSPVIGVVFCNLFNNFHLSHTPKKKMEKTNFHLSVVNFLPRDI